MRAGQLRHRVVIDSPFDSQDATGDPVRAWVTLATVWASIEPLRGREFTGGAAIRSEMDTKIRMRWSPLLDEMNERYRIVFGSKIYNVVSVAHIGLQHRELEIMCKSGVTQG